MNNYPDIHIHPSDHKNMKDWENIFAFFDSYFDYRIVGSVLDLAAGMGNVSCLFRKRSPGCRNVALDANPVFLESIVKRDAGIEVVQHDINKPLPFEDSSLDIVACLGTLHYPYIKDSLAIMSEMKRVSKKHVILDFLVRNSPYSFLQRIRHPKYNARKYTKDEMEHLIKALGFRIGAVRGGRAFVPQFFPYSGREVFVILEK